MRLYLVQHGEAVDSSIDPDRPLTKLGCEVVSKQAANLAQSGVVVSAIQHSGKTRARETAELLALALMCEGGYSGSDADYGADPGFGDAQMATIPMDPNAAIEPWITAVNTLSADVMLVGHQPFIGRLAAALAVGDAQRELVFFSPGTVLCLVCEQAVHLDQSSDQSSDKRQNKNKAGQWRILALLNPAL